MDIVQSPFTTNLGYDFSKECQEKPLFTGVYASLNLLILSCKKKRDAKKKENGHIDILTALFLMKIFFFKVNIK